MSQYKTEQLARVKSWATEEMGNLRAINDDNPQYVLGWNASKYICLTELLSILEDSNAQDEIQENTDSMEEKLEALNNLNK